VAWRFRPNASTQQLSIITVGLTAGQMITAIQALGAISQLKIALPEPIKSIMAFMTLFTFDLDLFQLPCVFTEDNAVVQFALKLIFYPCFALLLTVIFGVSKLAGKPLDSSNLLNINGMLLFVMFISLTLAVMLPFQCRDNPNGMQTMATNPGFQCFENPDHLALTVLSVLGILAYPVGILSWIAWVTLRFKSLVNSNDGVRALKCYRFLFSRFRPEGYYFGLIFLIRNAFVAAIPTVLVRVPEIHMLAMGAVVMAGCFLQVRCWPWRTASANYSDMIIGALLLLVLIGSAPFLDIPLDVSGNILGVLMTVVVVAALVACLAALALAVYKRLRPQKSFGMFLCHHKAGAVALCRQLKLSMASYTASPIFLDSDQLEDLDLIFDVVRSEVANLVIILSPELLTRMWCAGEIVTGHQNSVHIVPVICDGFAKPSDLELESIQEVWTDEQKATLLSFDITMPMVVDAYRHIMTLPALNMPRLKDFADKELVIWELVQVCKLSTFHYAKKPSAKQATGARRPQIIITGAITDAEALSACEIVRSLMQRQLQTVEIELVRSVEEAESYASTAVVFLVLLSRGLLQDPAFARILLEVLKDEGEGPIPSIVTVSADTGFQFPAGDFYTKLEAEGLGTPDLGAASGYQLSAAYRSLLAILAMPFNPLGSEGLIDTQISEVLRRTSKLLKTHDEASKKMGKITSSRSSTRLTASITSEAPDTGNDTTNAIEHVDDEKHSIHNEQVYSETF